MKTNYPSLFGFVAAAALAFATMSPIARASDYDGSVWLTSAVQAPNGGTWIQLHTGIETGKTKARGGAPVYESVDEPGTIVSAPGKVGYWVVGKRESIHARGQASELCGGDLRNCSNYPVAPEEWEYVTFAVATPDGQGL
jgi:hypothetical protein